MASISSSSFRSVHMLAEAVEPSQIDIYKSELDEINDQLAVPDCRTMELFSSLIELDLRAAQIKPDSSATFYATEKLQKKIKKAAALVKAKTIQYLDQQIKEISKEVSAKSPFETGRDFSKIVVRVSTLRLQMHRSLQHHSLTPPEKEAVAGVDTQIGKVFAQLIRQLPSHGKIPSSTSASSSSSSASSTSSSSSSASSTFSS